MPGASLGEDGGEPLRQHVKGLVLAMPGPDLPAIKPEEHLQLARPHWPGHQFEKAPSPTVRPIRAGSSTERIALANK
eukprot:1188306-Prorocentrum_minimum.AAC.4